MLSFNIFGENTKEKEMPIDSLTDVGYCVCGSNVVLVEQESVKWGT